MEHDEKHEPSFMEVYEAQLFAEVLTSNKRAKERKSETARTKSFHLHSSVSDY